jgi:hypothetical protein
MKKNVGGTDRLIRLVGGASLIGVGLGMVRAKKGLFIAAAGLALLITGITRFCSIYALLNIDTSDREPDLDMWT